MSEIARENPAHPSEIVGSVPASDAGAVAATVRRADRAWPEWACREVTERAAMLVRAWTVAAPATGHLLTRELGKVESDSVAEVEFAGRFLSWVAEHAPALLVDRETDDTAGRLVVEQRPYGVVAAITPWNAPVILAMLKVAPALVAGNCVVVKPSPLAPLAITDVLSSLAAALPAGVLEVVHGDREAGEALVGDPLVRKVAFTGGGAAGRAVGVSAAKQLTPMVLELGGNDPAVFLDDVEVTEEVAERLLVAAFATSGQVCMAVKRVYAHRQIAASLVDALVAAAERTVVMGDPLQTGVTLGPMVTRAAADRVVSLVDEARRRGATVIPVGRSADVDPSGYYCRPTVVTGIADEAPLVSQEQFGPALPILTFDSEPDVIARANADTLGLGASVWSADEERAFRLARRLDAGFRFVNVHNRAGLTLRAPFGGVKRSGFGREYAAEGILEYVQPCAVHAPASVRSGSPPGAASAYPSG